MIRFANRVLLTLCAAVLFVTVPTTGVAQDQGLREIQIVGSADGESQPAMIFVPQTDPGDAVPLLVILHSWSADYRQANFIEPCLQECRQRKWALIHPNFRGPNLRPQACGSDLAVQDVLDAVAFMQDRTKIDSQRIYLVGTSGGGHMSLLMAGRAPRLWAGVSAWVPISDIAAWHAERTVRGGNDDKYRRHMQAVCGGAPSASAATDKQYKHRSPLTHLGRATDVPIDINTGIHDGHTGSVPISQSVNAYNLLASKAGQADRMVTADQLSFMLTQRRIPKKLADEKIDEAGRIKPVLFRRKTHNARITIFDGGHEGDMPTAVRWLASQRKKKP